LEDPSFLSQLDRRFIDAAPDPAIFLFEGENLAKLFLDEYCSFQFAASGPGWSPKKGKLSFLALVNNIIRLLRGIYKLLSTHYSHAEKKKFVFFGAHGRTVEDRGELFDLYNYNVIQKLVRSDCLILESIPVGRRKLFQPDFLLHDFVIPRIIYQFLLRKKIKAFSEKLSVECPGLGFSERYITKVLSKYLAQKKILRIILRVYGPGKAYLVCHYGQEAFTAACKSLGIEVVELMHGLIFPSNPYYCSSNFTPDYIKAIRNGGQLPDKLGVFGPGWRELIGPTCYFANEDILDFGYYLKTQIDLHPRKEVIVRDGMGRKTILITTQPLYQTELVDYVCLLKNKLNKMNWRIIIKIHPNENGEVYNPICEEGFVEISRHSIYRLLPGADFHIGVASTVIFEAILFDIYNYVLYVPWEATTCDEIIGTGVAQKLKADELPLPYLIDKTLKNRFFSEFINP
jgi:hypothetical protein